MLGRGPWWSDLLLFPSFLPFSFCCSEFIPILTNFLPSPISPAFRRLFQSPFLPDSSTEGEIPAVSMHPLLNYMENDFKIGRTRPPRLHCTILFSCLFLGDGTTQDHPPLCQYGNLGFPPPFQSSHSKSVPGTCA